MHKGLGATKDLSVLFVFLSANACEGKRISESADSAGWAAWLTEVIAAKSLERLASIPDAVLNSDR